jgi:hypothetical protein
MANNNNLYPSYTPPEVPKNRIFKPTVLTDADLERIREIKNNFDDSAKSLDDIFGGSEYVSSIETGMGFSSSNQLDVDYSKFENHAFFGSAEQYVITAFSKILSNDGDIIYPYAATEAQYQTYLNNLSGFENWVFVNFPKNTGFLHFNGSSYVVCKDVPASLLASDREISGTETLNPITSSMTIEFWLNSVGTVSPTTGTLFDFTNGSNGYKIEVLSDSTNGTFLVASMVSGSREESISIPIPNSFEHYACIFDRRRELDNISVYINSQLSGSSERENEIGAINVTGGKFYIGVNNSGGSAGTNFLTGSVDELRVWKSVRTPEQLSINSKRTMRSQDNLLLLFDFNEINNPSSSVQYVIDHSGQELHGVILGTTGSNFRQTTGSLVYGLNPMIYETPSPILYPSYEPITDFYKRLLTTAIQYDLQNPNLITKLIPQEVLRMSQTGIDTSLELERRQQPVTQLSQYIFGSTISKQSDIKGVLEAFLFMMARMFDELKIFVDQYKELQSTSFGSRRFPDKLLNDMLSRYGIDLKSIFSETSLDQFLKGENVQINGDLIAESLEEIRGVIWRRVFNSMTGLLKSKGTRESLKGMFRAIGIDPDSNFRIKEFGGFNQSIIENRFIRNSRNVPFIDFSNEESIGLSVPAFYIYDSSIKDPWDGFHVEMLVQFQNIGVEAFPQSIGRLSLNNPVSGLWETYGECVAYSGMGGDPRVEFSYMPVSSSVGPIRVSIEGDYFDGRIYRIGFGRKLYNSGTLGNVVGDYYISTNSVEYDDLDGIKYSVIENQIVDNDIIADGSDSLYADRVEIRLLFKENIFEDTQVEVQNANLSGFINAEYKIAEIHSYNISLENTAINNIHALNPFSVATSDLSSELFSRTITVDSLTSTLNNQGNLFNVVQLDQALNAVDGTLPIITSSIISGFQGLVLTNFAQTFDIYDGVDEPQNVVSLFSSSQEVGEDPRIFNVVNYRELTMDWDRSGADDLDRIVIREGNDAISPSLDLLPVYDPRVSIDFSIVDALNNDISLIISNLQTLGNSISSYKNRYLYDFQELQYLRKIYFSRLSDKIQLKQFFEFFRYFDDNLIDFLIPLIPARVEFLGGRFIVEPHALERSKNVYQDYNALYSVDKSPREIREGAQVGLIQGSFARTGSQLGGITAGYYHNGGISIHSVGVNVVSPTRGVTNIEGVMATSVLDMYVPVKLGNGTTASRQVDYDEGLEFNFRKNLFNKGDNELMRILFGEDI